MGVDEVQDMTRSQPRLQGFFLVLWNGLCGCVLIRAWSEITQANRRNFVEYFQPYVPFCAMLWLWCLNVRVFERLHVPYEKLFGSDDARFLLRSDQLSPLAQYLTTALFTAVTAYVVAAALEAIQVAQWIPVVFLGIIVFSLVFPFTSAFHPSQAFFAKTLRRVLLPFQSVTFADFLLADVLTSLARSLSDLEHSMCYMVYEPILEKDDAVAMHCGRGAWHTNAVVAAPYLIRMVQCVTVFMTEGDEMQLFNAVKYVTALPVIFSSMMKHHAADLHDVVSKDFWIEMWILASVVNTAFSFFWDIEMDWDIMWFRRDKAGAGGWLPRLQPDTLYSPKGLYYFAIVTNFVIRIAWIYKLSVHVHYSLAFQLIVAILEVARRCQWMFIRIENGLRKQAKQLSLKEVHTKM